MERWTVCLCVVLLASVALALPGARRATEKDDVEEVTPVQSGRPSSRGREADVVPFGFGLGGFGSLGRPLGPRTSAVDDEEESVPSGYFPTGFLHPYFVDPMTSFMAQMAEMMHSMRRQMNQVLSRLPSDSEDWSKLGNTTSTTKVIDGHVVTVNETTITKDGDDSGSVIRIRVVDVHPQGTEEGETNSTTEDASKHADNEITKVGSEVDDLNA